MNAKFSRTLTFSGRNECSTCEELVLKFEPESDEAPNPDYWEG